MEKGGEKRKNEQVSSGKGMERFCTENYFTVISSYYNLLSLHSLLLLWLKMLRFLVGTEVPVQDSRL